MEQYPMILGASICPAPGCDERVYGILCKKHMTLDTMTCPLCHHIVTKEKHSDPFVCNCGWKSN